MRTFSQKIFLDFPIVQLLLNYKYFLNTFLKAYVQMKDQQTIEDFEHQNCLYFPDLSFYFWKISLKMTSLDTARANKIPSETNERKDRWVCAESFTIELFLVLEIFWEHFVLVPWIYQPEKPMFNGVKRRKRCVPYKKVGQNFSFSFFWFSITAWLFLGKYHFFWRLF